MLIFSIFYYKKNILFLFFILVSQGLFGCENKFLTQLNNYANVSSLNSVDIIKNITEDNDLNLCNTDNFLLSEDNANVYELSKTEYVVEVFCFVGAYQGSYQFLFYDANQVEHQISGLSFTVFEETGNGLQIIETSLLTGSVEFDPEMMLLMVDRKARGLGDCGSYGVYRWENNSFVLAEYRYKGECDGVYIPVEDYPLIYP
ncbi:DUF1176 domain-containing protein [Cyanobacterium stanieri LEGE 03274]|uniref:DUF1176 domain-containing protein n=1 Tax=Cyanobacterium stanieri LEGE 03274 TaxID=1828756 RepID=A0ABR9V3W0_9CHRO|nr:DUF1176 domain-containing protein [Cyanobacterium stanieri]MBE9222584.1 DUF1176 domain-containing protein [Cyanobacterium stanieri LEGE 03274]